MKLLLLCVTFFISLSPDAFGANEARYAVQEPKGSTMNLTVFVPKILDFPFRIKYPEKWYVREELAGNVPILYVTREPIRKSTDKYTVGMGLFYRIEYFKRAPDSRHDKMAEAAMRLGDWTLSCQRYAEDLKSQGQTVVAQENTFIDERPTQRIVHESQELKALTFLVWKELNFIVITFEAPLQEFTEYERVFEDMANSLTFTR
jgi:hypothetical protein